MSVHVMISTGGCDVDSDAIICIAELMLHDATIFIIHIFLKIVPTVYDVFDSKINRFAFSINNIPKKNDLKKLTKYLLKWTETEHYDSFFLDP